MNQGAVELRAVMGRLELTQSTVGERVGASQVQVSTWASGRGLPSRRAAVLLQREFGIGPLLWDEPAPEVTDDTEAA